MTNYLHSQIKSESIKPFQYSFSDNAQYLGGNIYVDMLNGIYFDQQGKSSYLYKLSNTLKPLDSLRIDNRVTADTNLYGFNILLAQSDESIFLLQGYFESDSFKQDIIQVDSTLSIINQFTLPRIIEGREAWFFDLAIKDSTVYASGALTNTQGYDDGLIVSTDLMGNLLKYGVVKADTLSNGSRDAHLLSLYVGDTVILGGLQYAWDEHLAVFDRDLNLLDLKSLFTPLDTFGYRGWIDFVKNDFGTPLIHSVTVTYYPSRPLEEAFYKTIGLVHLDHNYNILNRDTLPYKGWEADTLTNFIEYSEFGSASFSYSSEDTIVSAVTDNTVFWATWPVFQFFNVSTNTYISAFDNKNESVIWTKVYNNGVAHKAEEVTALPNNRWLLTFNEYDWNTYGPDNLAVRLMIIDGNGNPIGINEDEEKALTQEPEVFPNPAQDYLTISNLHWPGNDYTYQISDVNGRVVQKGRLPMSGTINLRESLRGIYVLTITNQTGFGWASKVIIE